MAEYDRLWKEERAFQPDIVARELKALQEHLKTVQAALSGVTDAVLPKMINSSDRMRVSKELTGMTEAYPPRRP